MDHAIPDIVIGRLPVYLRELERMVRDAGKTTTSSHELAERLDVTAKTIQNNIRALEKAGLITRELRRTAAGDWNSNIYHLDGLVQKVQALEPDFSEARRKRKEAKANAETPAGRRVKSK